jgi:hypothetical protein
LPRIRIYQLANELGEKPKAFESTVRALGFSIKNYMSTLSEADADKVRAAVRKPASVPVELPPAAKTRRVARVRPATEKKPTPPPQTAPEPVSRVVRNEDGVIVAATRRSEPKILGYISVPARRKRTPKVIVQTATAEQPICTSWSPRRSPQCAKIRISI